MADPTVDVETDKFNPPYAEIDPTISGYCQFLESSSLVEGALHRCRLSHTKKWYHQPCTKAHNKICLFAHLKLALPNKVRPDLTKDK
jgi:hypothetical protein